MPKIDIWMPWYIADYQSDTAHLNPPQDSAYRRLLEHQWKTRRPLPDDILALVQITRMSPFFVDASSIPQACVEQAASIGRASANKDDRLLYAWLLDLLQQFFFRNADGTWSQLRLEKELQRWGEKNTNAVEKARKAAWNRWHGPNSSDPQPMPDWNKSGDAPSIARAQPEQSPSPSPEKLKYQRPSYVGPGVRNAPVRSGAPIGSKRSRPSKGESEAKPAKQARQAIAGGSGMGKAVKRPIDAAHPQKIAISGDSGGREDGKKRDRGVDARFGPFREEIFRAYGQMHSVGLVLTKSPSWGPRERSQLSDFLRDNPEVNFSIFKTALVNWSKSPRTNHAAPPYTWISKLMEHSVADVDRYGVPVQRRRRF